MQPPAPFAHVFLQWITGRLGPSKAEPRSAEEQAAEEQATVHVPLCELERLNQISPHLLADIGVARAASAGDASPWRLKDGRHLLLRPPL